MSSDAQAALAKECADISDNCLYTSTSLFIWLRTLRVVRIVFIVLPLILGGLAGWSVLTASADEGMKKIVALFAFLAGLLPAIYGALKFDEAIKQCERLAGDFKNLQDRFRLAATVYSKLGFSEFESHVNKLLARLERARSTSYTAPEWCFWCARKKIQRGDYTPDARG